MWWCLQAPSLLLCWLNRILVSGLHSEWILWWLFIGMDYFYTFNILGMIIRTVINTQSRKALPLWHAIDYPRVSSFPPAALEMLYPMQRMMATVNSTKSKRPPGALLPISVDNFTLLRTMGYYYVDKTRFIDVLLNDSRQALLLKMHRRSTKSLFASTVAGFVDKSKSGIQISGPKTEKGICSPSEKVNLKIN